MKKCAQCGKKFEPTISSFQKVCSPKCGVAYAKKQRKNKEKQERIDRKEAKERLRTKREWIKITQPEFNRYIRLRDHDKPCISCGRYDHEINEKFTGGKWDCGHYLTVGAFPELRFEPLNAHKQCKVCNAGSGKYTRKNHTVGQDYRDNLIDRIGIENVEWIEGPHAAKHYTCDDLKAIKQKYAKMANELQRKLQAKA